MDRYSNLKVNKIPKVMKTSILLIKDNKLYVNYRNKDFLIYIQYYNIIADKQ